MSEQPAYSSNEHGLQHTTEHKPTKHNVNHQFHHILKSDAQRRLSAPLHKRLSLLSSPCSVEAKCKILASGFSKFSCQNDQNRHTTMSFRKFFVQISQKTRFRFQHKQLLIRVHMMSGPQPATPFGFPHLLRRS